MPTPPPFVAEYESNYTTQTATGVAKTASVTTTANGILAIFGVSETADRTLATPTGGGLTYALQRSVVITDYCTVYIWTAPTSTAQTFTLSITRGGAGGSGYWGFNCLRFGANGGVGASSVGNASGAPTLDLTTTADDSAVVVVNADWNAVSGTTRTWRTGAGALTEQTYSFTSARYTFYGGFHANAGVAGVKTVGLTAPTGQKFAIAAVEIKGVATAGPGQGGRQFHTLAAPG